MKPRDTVVGSTRAVVHQTPLLPDGAVDVAAPPGSLVRAPGDGRVVDVMKLPAPLAGWQIRGLMKREDGKEVGFVLAHLTRGSHPKEGALFRKGEILGFVARWPEHPNNSHAHWAFRRVGTGLPPPGNVKVLRAFERFGVMPT